MRLPIELYKTAGQRIEAGDLVSFRGSRGRQVEAIIVSTRYMRTGKTEIKARGTDGGDWTYTSPNGEYGSGITFIRKQDAQAVKEVQFDHAQRQDDRADKVEALAEAGRKVIKSLNLAVGDTVVVNYTNGRQTETVVGLNLATGKVGIKRYRNQPDDYKELMALYSGRTIRDIRWLHGKNIGAVVQRFKDSHKGVKPCPVKMTPKIISSIELKGFAQVTFGSEFIESSYVLAFTAENARKGENYEVASKDVYFDPNIEVFWRATGSFD